jgi:hypothetical protein
MSKTIKVIGDVSIFKGRVQPTKGGSSYNVTFTFDGKVKRTDLVVVQYTVPYKDERHIDRDMIKHVNLYVMSVKDNRLRAVNVNLKDDPTGKIKIGDELPVYGNAYEKY